MLLVSNLKLWFIGVFIFFYVIAVLILATISVQGIKKNQYLPRGMRGGAQEYGLKKQKVVHWCSELKYVKVTEKNHHTKPVGLVSFPGSGNTWLRYLLQQATGYYTGSVYNDYGLSKTGFPAEKVINRSVIVVKTHEWGSKVRNMFSKVILLIRSPGPAIQAEFNRQSGDHTGYAPSERYKRFGGKYWQQFVTEKAKVWKQLNLDWLCNFTGPIHVLRYENLVNDTKNVLESVINFLGVFLNTPQFHCALERREGIYRRKKYKLDFNPFHPYMEKILANVEDIVRQAEERFRNKHNKTR